MNMPQLARYRNRAGSQIEAAGLCFLMAKRLFRIFQRCGFEGSDLAV
jgi:hypothetical protein